MYVYTCDNTNNDYNDNNNNDSNWGEGVRAGARRSSNPSEGVVGRSGKNPPEHAAEQK